METEVEESDLEESSRVSELVLEVDREIERTRKRKKEDSSPLEKQVDRDEMFRTLEEEIREMQDQNRKMRLAWEEHSRMIEAKLEEFKGFKQMLGNGEDGFQKVERKKKKEKKVRAGASQVRGKERKIQVEKLENGNVRVIADTTEEVSEVVQEKIEEVRKPSRNPAIHVRDRKDMDVVQTIIDSTEVKAELMLDKFHGGFKILSRGSEDYRRLTGSLRESGIGAHWHLHREDRPLWTVIKNIPAEMRVEEVKEELEELGVEVKNAVRMRKNKEEPYDMVAVATDRSEEGKKIFGVEKLANFRVRVESKRKPTKQQQCFRCQRFGHVAFRCTAKEACAFCAGPHASKGCQQERGRGSKAKCANCGGDHPSFFSSCPRHPEQVRKLALEDRERRTSRAREAGVRPGRSYAGVAGNQPGRKEEADSVDKVRVDEWESRIKAILLKVLPEILKPTNGEAR